MVARKGSGRVESRKTTAESGMPKGWGSRGSTFRNLRSGGGSVWIAGLAVSLATRSSAASRVAKPGTKMRSDPLRTMHMYFGGAERSHFRRKKVCAAMEVFDGAWIRLGRRREKVGTNRVRAGTSGYETVRAEKHVKRGSKVEDRGSREDQFIHPRVQIAGRVGARWRVAGSLAMRSSAASRVAQSDAMGAMSRNVPECPAKCRFWLPIPPPTRGKRGVRMTRLAASLATRDHDKERRRRGVEVYVKSGSISGAKLACQ
jgi:hypothetical protein